MKIALTLEGSQVRLERSDDVVQTMTFEQYEKHARDPAFIALFSPADVALVQAAIDAAAKPAA